MHNRLPFDTLWFKINFVKYSMTHSVNVTSHSVQTVYIIYEVHLLFSEVKYQSIILSDNSRHSVLRLFCMMRGSAVLVAIPIC